MQTPITKVVEVLQNMKDQVQAEAAEDEELYRKMECWCTTNKAQKAMAMEQAQGRVQQLEFAMEQGNATSLSLSNEIKALRSEILESQEALAQAMSVHAGDKQEFHVFHEDVMESITLLRQALDALKSVSLAQIRGHQSMVAEQSLLAVRRIVSNIGNPARRHARFGGTMQKDLWDLMSTLASSATSDVRPIMELNQQPVGAAAGAKSYSARSSSIVGILQQMAANMEAELAGSQKQHVQAEISFQRLRSTKEREVQLAQATLEDKWNTLADIEQELIENARDLDITRSALDADQRFMLELQVRCNASADDYASRRSMRLDEIVAISEAITLLRADDARDNISRAISLVQLSTGRRKVSTMSEFRRRLSMRASSRLMALASLRRREGTIHGALALAKFAVGVQSDGLDKVKELMTKMINDLKKQQSEEHGRHEGCVHDIRGNEADVRARQSDANELHRQIAALESTSFVLKDDLQELANEVSEAHVSLNQASQERLVQSHEFQQLIADQHAAQAVINQALERLRKFYDEQSFLAVSRRVGRRGEPGKAASQQPPAGLAYQKNRAAPGVLSLLEKVVQDCDRIKNDAIAGEQAAQDAYAELVANINNSLDAAVAAIQEKTHLQAKTARKLAEAKQGFSSTAETLHELHDASTALHLQCDFLLRNFKVRQTARQENIEAIQEAESILAGADFRPMAM